MKINALIPEPFNKMDAYWRAANYLSFGQIYPYYTPLLKQQADRVRQYIAEHGKGPETRHNDYD